MTNAQRLFKLALAGDVDVMLMLAKKIRTRENRHLNSKVTNVAINTVTTRSSTSKRATESLKEHLNWMKYKEEHLGSELDRMEKLYNEEFHAFVDKANADYQSGKDVL